MTEMSPWEVANEYQGSTDSERYLTKLARKTFLSLWSYPNAFVDKGRHNGKGDGKELCDLLIVFGNNILIFSDKDCAYSNHSDKIVAWKRWYRSAIQESVNQLIGAERNLKYFSDRLYLDKKCTVPFPLQLPSPTEARFFLVAVTRGSYDACVDHWNHQSSGSLMIDTTLIGSGGHNTPFTVGWPAGKERFVHVLDELTLDVLLGELDTPTDFVEYLVAKEQYLSTPDVEFNICGEEELYVQYALTLQDTKHTFPPIPAGVTHYVIPEGDWEHYLKSPQRAQKKAASEASYFWDDLIEHHSNFIRSGEAIVPDLASADPHQHEFVMRAMAEESRLNRRLLADSLLHVIKNNRGHCLSRIAHSGANPNRAYVFLSVSNRFNEKYDSYRRKRSGLLAKYLVGSRLRFENITEAIGIATDPASAKSFAQDFIYMKFTDPLTDELRNDIRAEMDKFGIMREDIQISQQNMFEYPLAFERASPAESHNAEIKGMNRAQRRKYAAMKRKK